MHDTSTVILSYTLNPNKFRVKKAGIKAWRAREASYVYISSGQKFTR